ncbi:hypothetical protein DDZ16_10110 [Marinilabilia rubra]|uniref:Uncharacterized protein n=1 Tax=Marinilabilia rubra TaxID=2162893 RepID=A0A2U2B8I8_9BACT|nr:hypothetical protein DDZ16_10110 [Marinilabilia rubra]
MNVIGKPYAGKPHVRFDEGATKSTNGWLCTLLYRDNKVIAYKKTGRKIYYKASEIEAYLESING